VNAMDLIGQPSPANQALFVFMPAKPTQCALAHLVGFAVTRVSGRSFYYFCAAAAGG
jgi:hypothetical protein